MIRRTKNKQTEMLLLLIVNEMKQTNRVYYAYPKRYNQKVVDTKIAFMQNPCGACSRMHMR